MQFCYNKIKLSWFCFFLNNLYEVQDISSCVKDIAKCRNNEYYYKIFKVNNISKNLIFDLIAHHN